MNAPDFTVKQRGPFTELVPHTAAAQHWLDYQLNGGNVVLNGTVSAVFSALMAAGLYIDKAAP